MVMRKIAVTRELVSRFFLSSVFVVGVVGLVQDSSSSFVVGYVTKLLLSFWGMAFLCLYNGFQVSFLKKKIQGESHRCV